jgi:hydrogenase nickel incorporation protein HypA/HybF
MHELSIANAVVSIAGNHARGRRVTSVRVQIGHLRQVVPDALQFSFQLLTDGTSLEGAQLEIDHVAARVTCHTCGETSDVHDFPLTCASCSAMNVEVVAGNELLVESLELEDEPTPVGRR